MSILLITCGEKCEPSKSMQPKIYYYENDKRGSKVPNLFRTTEEDYKIIGKEYVYTIGLPVSEIEEEFKKFEIVAYDVISPYKKLQFFIDEVFMVKKSSTGELTVNRAPTSYAVTQKSKLNQMSLHVEDGTGVSIIDMKTLPKAVGKETDTIRSWNGRAADNWSSIAKVTANGEYVKDGLTKFEKIDTIFKKTNWVGQNPKLADEDGIYVVLVTAEDASGAFSAKTMFFDTRYYISGDSYIQTGNGTVTTPITKIYDPTKQFEEKLARDNSKTNSNKDNSESSSDINSEKKTKSSSKSDSSSSSESSGGNSDGNSESSSSGSSNESSEGNSSGSSESSSSESSKKSTSETSNSSNSTLKKGSKGEEVKKLQRMLNSVHNGRYRLEVDGDFGSSTEKAVKDFQSLHKLEVDGIVGEKTWDELQKEVEAETKRKSENSSKDNLYSTLKKGSKGEEVKTLQKMLNSVHNGRYRLEVDGEFGSATEKAVKDFQSLHKLEVDGIVGEKTWAALQQQVEAETKKSEKSSSSNSSSNSQNTSSGSTGNNAYWSPSF